MIEVEAVWRLIDESSHPLPPERVGLREAEGRILAEEARADADHPPFDRSAMDGYAIGIHDSSADFAIIETLRAGDSKPRSLRAGEAVRIFTGAELPDSELKVVMQENCVVKNDRLRIIRSSDDRFVRKSGEDFREGDLLLAAGTRIGAVESALLASIGKVQPKVASRPRVLHFTSGNEIVPPDQTPGRGQIRNTNAALLAALLDTPIAQVHLSDQFEPAWQLIQRAEPDSFDLILFSGGASVGEHDFAQRFLRELGFSIHCSTVNVRPGKPLIFASRGRQIAFGIPGNPVSHFVCHHLFVARALARLTGCIPAPMEPWRLTHSMPGKPNPRVTFWPAAGHPGAVTLLPWNSSGHLASLRGVNALIRIPSHSAPGAGEIAEGLGV